MFILVNTLIIRIILSYNHYDTKQFPNYCGGKKLYDSARDYLAYKVLLKLALTS